MTTQQIKEQLSFHYVGAIAAVSGHKFFQPDSDHGVDLLIAETRRFHLSTGKTEISDTGRLIAVQLKCTTRKSVEYTTDAAGMPVIKYSLRGKDYRNLVRNIDSGAFPLLFILVILESDVQGDWLKVLDGTKGNPSGLLIDAAAYWFYPQRNQIGETDVYNKRISIPVANRVDAGFFETVFIKEF